MRLGAQLFLVKISFIHDFHIQGWALTLFLKQRPGGTGKWPILNVQCKLSSRTLVTASLSGKLFLWPPPQNAVFSTPIKTLYFYILWAASSSYGHLNFSRSEGVRLLEIPLYCVSCILYLGRRGGAVWCEHSPLTLTRVQIPSRRRDMSVEFFFPLFREFFFFGYCTVLYSNAIRNSRWRIILWMCCL